MRPPEREWFGLQVRAKCEKAVGISLSQKGYESFVPFSHSHPLVASSGGARESVLFPGYVFCRMNGGSCGLLVTTQGVIRIVGMGNRPVPIDPMEMDSLQRICASGEPAIPCNYLREGETVSIAGGPLAGVVGILVRFHGESRVVVSVTLCASSISVEVDARDVWPLHRGPVLERGRVAFAAVA
jgi:transcription antitermination factor NusG